MASLVTEQQCQKRIIPFVHSSDDTVGIVALIIETVQLAVLIGSVVSVEKTLKRTFDENGVRKMGSY